MGRLCNNVAIGRSLYIEMTVNVSRFIYIYIQELMIRYIELYFLNCWKLALMGQTDHFYFQILKS